MSFFFSAQAVIPVSSNSVQEYTVESFLELDFADYSKIQSRKNKVINKIEFKVNKFLLKRQLKKERIQKDDAFTPTQDGFKWNWGGFLIGLVLNGIGVLIVALLFPVPRKNAVISAIIGMAIGLTFTFLFGLI